MLYAASTIARALMYDVIVPHSQPPAVCEHGCAAWSNLAIDYSTANQAYVNSLWANASTQQSAGSLCAMPANYTGEPGAVEVSPDVGLQFDFSLGPLCYCKGTAAQPTSSFGYCDFPEVPWPAQVNVLVGPDPSQAVVTFVTVDWGQPSVNPPLVELCTGPGIGEGSCSNVTGTSSTFPEPQDPSRVYTVHNVLLQGLPQDGSTLVYRVRGGTAAGAGNWAGPYPLHTAPAAAPVSLLVVGDLGPYPYACYSNMLADVTDGYIVPEVLPSTTLYARTFIHLGDHAYNMAMGNGSRGDAYMLGMEPLVSSIPWAPVMGNHELEGSPFGSYCTGEQWCQGRYLNQTSGLHFAASASGSTDTRFYSFNLPLVHIVVLDYNPYIGLQGLDNPSIRATQLAWFAADLSAVDRSVTPWIIVTAHVPLYCSGDPGPADLMADVEPLLLRYHVDLHIVGHEHIYESTWPVGPNGKVAGQSFVNPSAPVHVVTGAGGAPAFDDPATPPAWSRKQIQRWSYSRLTVWNSSALTLQQVDNMNNTVLDSWTIAGATHGR